MMMGGVSSSPLTHHRGFLITGSVVYRFRSDRFIHRHIHANTHTHTHTHTPVMFTGTRTESRGDSGVLDAAALRQQRRLKQAIQFLHKDSADLLPLDGLKKLGTSKQGQPHHILQKRLLEAKLSRDQMNMCGGTPNSAGVLVNCTHFTSHEEEDEEQDDFIYVPCKCLGQEVNVLIDTGCKLNLMSSLTVEKLGLKALVEENKMETDGFPFQRKICIDGHIREFRLTIGHRRIVCSFVIVESDRPLMSLGNKTLKSLKVNHPLSPMHGYRSDSLNHPITGGTLQDHQQHGDVNNKDTQLRDNKSLKLESDVMFSKRVVVSPRESRGTGVNFTVGNMTK